MKSHVNQDCPVSAKEPKIKEENRRRRKRDKSKKEEGDHSILTKHTGGKNQGLELGRGGGEKKGTKGSVLIPFCTFQGRGDRTGGKEKSPSLFHKKWFLYV